ncbi:MAG: dihydrolipoamide succinyltransferase [Piptocephalis tieghemiana]|nr:MAG: dihydrolipoamide succinyltransferase [Piptocephalis tieghemiana]
MYRFGSKSTCLSSTASVTRSALRQSLAPTSRSYAVRSLSSTSLLSRSANLPLAAGTSNLKSALRPSLPSLTWAPSRGYADKVVQVPTMGDSITEGTLKSWTKQVGDYVEADEEVASIETDKVDVSVNAPVSGKVTKHFANEEDTVEVGSDLFTIEEGAAGEKPAPKEESSKPEEPKQEAKQEEATPAPAKEEPKPAASTSPPAPKPSPPKPSSPAPSASSSSASSSSSSTLSGTTGTGNRTERHVKMNRMRLRIAERLKESQNTAASLTTFNEIDMTNLMALRTKYKDAVLKKHNVKLGFMSAFVRASAVALQEVPGVNATIVGPNGGDTIVYRDYVDISVAVATPKGLVTPILRNVEDMSFVGVEKSIAALSSRARDGKLTLEDMVGGTFTISNGGVFGSLYGTPIINMPQSAILGMHAIKERPVAINGKVEIRPMMYVALTYDHRLIDGREAVTFLVKLKEAVEDPSRLLLEV